MDLKEFLAQNPQAEADVLAYAKTKLTGEPEAAVKAETERIGKLLALGGVQLSDEIKAAIQGGKTLEEYAVAELAKQREIQAKLSQQGTPPAPGHVGQTPAEQAGKPPEAPSPDTITEEGLSEYAALNNALLLGTAGETFKKGQLLTADEAGGFIPWDGGYYPDGAINAVCINDAAIPAGQTSVRSPVAIGEMRLEGIMAINAIPQSDREKLRITTMLGGIRLN